ncbi:unnamed protein product, partial [Mesorhabditis spiculigera]
MASEDVEMEDVEAKAEPVEVIPFRPVSVLQVITKAQAEHGLRHGDFKRYWKYCADRLKRMRRHAGMVHKNKSLKRHKSKFEKKHITDENFTSETILEILIFECERCWATGMHMKDSDLDGNANSRKRQEIFRKLKRAVHHAEVLEGLVGRSPRCAPATKLEAQAYLSFLMGFTNLEMKRWGEAYEKLKAARAIFERLAEATNNTGLKSLYKTRCDELQPQLRICEYNTEGPETKMAKIGELMELRLQINDKEDVDKLIAQMRAKAASDQVIEISWGGEKTTVSEEKALAVISGWHQSEKELAECRDPKERMALYEKQLADTRDAIDKMSDLIRRNAADNVETQSYQLVRCYLDYLRLSSTAERYLAMIENTKSEKKYRPQDLLRLYDSVIEIYKEVKEVNGAACDEQLMAASRARIEYYRAFRCHYMAAAYGSLGKLDEASALFGKTEERIREAERLLKSVGKGNPYLNESSTPLASLLAETAAARAAVNAERLAAASSDTQAASEVDGRPLVETLDEWRQFPTVAAALQQANIVVLPPPPLPMPGKATFFDLAHFDLQMPDLSSRLARLEEERKTQQQRTAQKSQAKKGGRPEKKTEQQQPAEGAPAEESGLTNMVKGWFWNKK